MKKSQIQTQIFVYILALIVIALVLLYGYTSIKNFMKRSDEVALVQFRTDFSNSVEVQSHEFKSVIKKEILLPRGYDTLIIVNLSTPNTSTEFRDKYPLVYDSWQAGVERNVFLVGSSVEAFYAGKMYFDNSDHKVINAPDRVVKLKLTGMGSSTKIEKWN